MIEFEKYYNEDGKVGVLISCGFGVGWSTWNDASEYLAMSKDLIAMKLNGATREKVTAFLEGKFSDVYCGGWDGCYVKYLEKGTAFRIKEYDGNESLEIIGQIDYMTA